ncbi:MAG: hypothetical protein E6Y23_00135 [Negativicoccus massiliensis]|nr:hypothetical protein [Negativicoccus succinicivorans]MBS5887313.1 hypothetical protein [Negativicoccus succinicivorans]MDU3214577.1 hypothetical protein [Negativicoccus succinicivorans]MDU4641155.1 hypothetical protein [Negativicoccus massiliensis]MDU5026855.1 hypothetical protein [Negativicoccus succinicivorans]
MIQRISALLCSACLLGIAATVAAPPPPVPQAMPPTGGHCQNRRPSL